MRVKIFSHENIEALEKKANEFLATLTTEDVKHVNTAQGETETIITIWYDDLGAIAKGALGDAARVEEPVRDAARAR